MIRKRFVEVATCWFFLMASLVSCSRYVPPARVVGKTVVVGDTPVAVITPPPAPPPLVVTQKIDESCKNFHPVYLTAAEVKLLSNVSLTSIVSNNKEGEIRCGWKEAGGR